MSERKKIKKRKIKLWPKNILCSAARPDDSVEMLASPSVEFGKMKDVLAENGRNEKFDEVQMFALVPHTRAYHPAATLKMEADIAAKGKNPDGSDPDKGPTVQEYVTSSTRKIIRRKVSMPNPRRKRSPRRLRNTNRLNSRAAPEEQLKAAAADLKLELKPEATRAEIIAAIQVPAKKPWKKTRRDFSQSYFSETNKPNFARQCAGKAKPNLNQNKKIK